MFINLGLPQCDMPHSGFLGAGVKRSLISRIRKQSPETEQLCWQGDSPRPAPAGADGGEAVCLFSRPCPSSCIPCSTTGQDSCFFSSLRDRDQKTSTNFLKRTLAAGSCDLQQDRDVVPLLHPVRKPPKAAALIQKWREQPGPSWPT